jgi:hypothetical protein
MQEWQMKDYRVFRLASGGLASESSWFWIRSPHPPNQPDQHLPDFDQFRLVSGKLRAVDPRSVGRELEDDRQPILSSFICQSCIR